MHMISGEWSLASVLNSVEAVIILASSSEPEEANRSLDSTELSSAV